MQFINRTQTILYKVIKMFLDHFRALDIESKSFPASIQSRIFNNSAARLLNWFMICFEAANN